VEVRALREQEAEEIRALRLRALDDAPFAFSSSRARELDRPEDFWQRLARASEEALSQVTFVAVEDDRWVGMAGVFTPPDAPGCGQVWGTWVSPSARQAGVGRELMGSIRAWATQRGLEQLRLSVSTSERSGPARRFYEALGFRATGEQEAMDSDPTLCADVMTLALR
jgi:GNAT superfamily N-acetyltransferase